MADKGVTLTIAVADHHSFCARHSISWLHAPGPLTGELHRALLGSTAER